MGATIRILTDEEFLNLPDAPGKQELLDGVLIALPPAKRPHSKLIRKLRKLLERTFTEERVCAEEGYRLKHGWLQPDVSVTWPDQAEGDWFLGAPMLAIEVASRGNTAEEIDRKTAAYLEDGAAEVWVVYPRTKSMVVSSQDGVQRVTGIYHSEAAGIAVNLAELFA